MLDKDLLLFRLIEVIQKLLGCLGFAAIYASLNHGSRCNRFDGGAEVIDLVGSTAALGGLIPAMQGDAFVNRGHIGIVGTTGNEFL